MFSTRCKVACQCSFMEMDHSMANEGCCIVTVYCIECEVRVSDLY